jgi:WD40 repeat protein
VASNQSTWLCSEPLAAVGDFGLSRQLFGTLLGNSKALNPTWLAPELLDGSGAFTEHSDVFAYGVVLWELFTRNHPYAHVLADVPPEIEHGVLEEYLLGGGRLTLPDDGDDACPASYRALVSSCFAEVGARPTFCDIVATLRRIACELLTDDAFEALDASIGDDAGVDVGSGGGESSASAAPRNDAPMLDLMHSIRCDGAGGARPCAMDAFGLSCSACDRELTSELERDGNVTACVRCDRVYCLTCLDELTRMCAQCVRVESDSALCMAWSPASAELWLGFASGRIGVTSGGVQTYCADADAHSGAVNAIVYSSSSVFSGGECGMLKVWRAESMPPDMIIDTVRMSGTLEVGSKSKSAARYCTLDSGVFRWFGDRTVGGELGRVTLAGDSVLLLAINSCGDTITLHLTEAASAGAGSALRRRRHLLTRSFRRRKPTLSISSSPLSSPSSSTTVVELKLRGARLCDWRAAMQRVLDARLLLADADGGDGDKSGGGATRRRLLNLTLERSLDAPVAAMVVADRGGIWTATADGALIQWQLVRPAEMTGLRTDLHELRLCRRVQLPIDGELAQRRPNATVTTVAHRALWATLGDRMMYVDDDGGVVAGKTEEKSNGSEIMALIVVFRGGGAASPNVRGDSASSSSSSSLLCSAESSLDYELWSGDTSGTVSVWRHDDERLSLQAALGAMQSLGTSGTGVTALTQLRRADVFSAHSNGVVARWCVDTRQVLSTHRAHARLITALAGPSSRSSNLYSTSHDHTIRLWVVTN